MPTELGYVENFGDYISLIWAYGSKVLLTFAVFFIVLGAFYYMASAGNDEKIEEGKEMIIGSLIAIVITLLSGVLIRLLHEPSAGTSGHLSEIPMVISKATNILISLIGTFALGALTFAGIMMMLSGGDEGKRKKAKKAFNYSIYGIIIGILSYGIANTLVNFLQ